MLNVILLNVVAPFQAQKCQSILKFFFVKKENEQNNLEANLFQICLQQLQHPIRGQGGINTLCYIDVCVPVLLL
jgi:hypothetical protein